MERSLTLGQFTHATGVPVDRAAQAEDGQSSARSSRRSVARSGLFSSRISSRCMGFLAPSPTLGGKAGMGGQRPHGLLQRPSPPPQPSPCAQGEGATPTGEEAEN